MNVLYVIPGLGIGGGAERSLLDLAPGLRAHGIALSIVYFHERPSSAADAFRAAGIPTHKTSGSRLPSLVREVRAAIRSQQPDIVHTTLYEADVVGRLASVGLPPKVLTSLVSTPYDPVRQVDPAYSAWRVALVRAVDAVTLRLWGDHVHANSETVKRSAMEHLHVPAERITVVPRGRAPVEPLAPDRRQELRAQLGIEPSAPVILMVGRQEATKDHVTLIEAVGAVVAHHPDLVVLLAGREGGTTAELAALVRARGLDGVVRTLGYRSDVADLLGVADVFAFPSLLEGMPGAVIEAMAAGVPIVASSIGPVRELVDESSAVLVPVRDPEALATGLLATLDDPSAAAQRAARARASFEASLTLGSVLEAMVRLYGDVGSR